MELFRKSTKKESSTGPSLAEVALRSIHDGVIMTDKTGVINFINPAAVKMTECGSESKAIGLDYGLVIKIESKEGRELSENENPLIQAMKTGQSLESSQVALISLQSGKRIPIAVSMHMADGISQNHVITFRNITKELAEEGEQTEFISTASHEMRTPVATIDGYLSLCLNPQTATIDDRARNYLGMAQNASKHLGKLFQDLLDVTKLDDGKIRPKFIPIEMTELTKNISNDYSARAKDAKINYSFGTDDKKFGEAHQLSQVVYGFVDVDFMHEIMDNLIENALKYTPEGGSIYINVRGDGDKVLINVTDTGMGISAEDLSHIFQKFYRADNSDTREIGGTGLGLYLVKQRVEAMGGKIWAESAFGEGSTFYVSLPRLSEDEYNKRMIAVQNQKMQPNAQPAPQGTQPSVQFISQPTIQSPTQPPIQQPITQQPTQQPMPQPTTQPSQPVQPITPPTVQPASQPSLQSITQQPQPIPPISQQSPPTIAVAQPPTGTNQSSSSQLSPQNPISSTDINPQSNIPQINNNLNGEAK